MKAATLVLVAFVLIASGCSSTPPVPDDRYYRLPGASPAGQTPLLRDGSIFVEQFTADGVYRDRAIAYSEASAPTTVRQHHYSFWLDSPGRMLQEQLEDYLRKDQAAPVITDVPWVQARLSIYGRILRLDRVLAPGAAKVQVALEFNVRQAGSDEPLLVKEYEAGASAAGQSVEASVAAFGTALSEIFFRLDGDLRSRLAKTQE